ncbi:DNA replication and repair protein RecF [Candidatus Gracilibacteria bacterium]|nr:DNA replication and repair protein RecF [Candidatus Gracilibacteria bacterium]
MIQSLALFDFRNYQKTRFQFSEKNVVFYGGNGRGKTNILEAISLLSVGKSWRERVATDLILHGQNSAKLEMRTVDGDMFQVIIEPRGRNFTRNGKKISLKSHFGCIPTLLFVPEHLSLFADSKRSRQRFFDRFLFQISPSYRDILARNNRTLKQKNALLRRESFSYSDCATELDAWNSLLAETIPDILHARQNLLKELNPILRQTLAEISGGKDSIEMRLEVCEKWQPTIQGVKEFFAMHGEREGAAKRSLIGPHRDDFSFFLRGRPIRSTASRGEERTVLLALLAAQKYLLQSKLEISPILLLDDVFSELDQSRQDYLEHLCNESQIFFTTTHKSHFENFSYPVQKIRIA